MSISLLHLKTLLPRKSWQNLSNQISFTAILIIAPMTLTCISIFKAFWITHSATASCIIFCSISKMSPYFLFCGILTRMVARSFWRVGDSESISDGLDFASINSAGAISFYLNIDRLNFLINWTDALYKVKDMILNHCKHFFFKKLIYSNKQNTNKLLSFIRNSSSVCN